MEKEGPGPVKRTSLFELHKNLNAKMINFEGWEMPLHYGSQREEHLCVRQKSGIFDVSHMTVVDVSGADSREYLRWLLANDIAKLKHPGDALYSVMMNDAGGVVDDVIVYFIHGNDYRIVINCATKEKDLQWMKTQAKEFDVMLQEKSELAILAVQGPEAIDKVKILLNDAGQEKITHLKPFSAVTIDQVFFARTGYTGEDGLEIICSSDDAAQLWNALVEANVKPCGLGARDSLRVEAGLNLYGLEMDEQTSPLIANLGWSVALEPKKRDFCGRKAVEHERSQCKMRLAGLVLKDRGMLRTNQEVCLSDGQRGVVTSGSYSPILGCSIALVRIPVKAIFKDATVKIRGKYIPAEIGLPRFVRKGKVIFKKES